MLATPTRNGFRVIDSFSRVVRLGEELPATGRLGEAAMERTVLALRLCLQKLARQPVRAITAVATEACRQATNGPEFLARIHRETGIHFRLISPREEASLVVESCAALLRGSGRRALLFDIGGGSTELAWLRLPGSDTAADPEIVGLTSIPFGVVTLAGAVGVDPFDPAGFETMVATLTEPLLAFERIHRIAAEMRAGGVQTVGTSGTVTTLAGEALGLDRYRRPLIDGLVLPIADAVDASLRLRRLDLEELAIHPCVGADRASLVIPGCAVFEAIRRIWPFPDVLVADRGLREGLLRRLIRKSGRSPHAPGHHA
jgi:exopolyphosphatase/guanosine-5'-triphosphate,3'-diphosphate pyrophosphatase